MERVFIMANNVCDKMIMAILQGDDYEQVIRALNRNGFYVTVLNSVGGFLKKRSVTIMVGLEHTRLDEALKILKDNAGQRSETVYQNTMPTFGSEPPMMPVIPVQVPCGGVTIFVLDIAQMERF